MAETKTRGMYRVSFERVGRNHSVPDLEVSGDIEDVLHAIRKVARRNLISGFFDVFIDADEKAGHIDAGFHAAGSFTIAQAEGAQS